MTESSDRATPVFIVAPTGRCGTNLLAAALVESGMCEFPSSDRMADEDFLLFNADLLNRYCDETVSRWERWVSDEKELARRRAALLRHLGEGLLRYALGGSARRSTVFKTPSPANLRLFPEIFPDAKLLVIVRDGRDVVESHCRAWPDRPRDQWIRAWAEGARRVIEFLGTYSGACEAFYYLVRYEDLIRRDSDCMLDVMRFLGFGEAFSWEDLDGLPVYGSSYLSPAGEGPFRWVVAPKPPGFSSVGRWRTWTQERQREFMTIAGAELRELGYGGAE